MVPCRAELAACCIHCVYDIGSRVLTIVDQFVADIDGVKDGPVPICSPGDVVKTGWEILQVENTGENFQVALSRCFGNLVRLVTVYAVDPDKPVLRQLVQVFVDLVLGLAGAIIVIRRVGDAKATVIPGLWMVGRCREWDGGREIQISIESR